MDLIWLSNEHPSNDGHEENVRGKITGAPKPTATATVAQLRAMGMIGVYRRPMTIAEIQVELDLRCGGKGGVMEPAVDAEALLLAEGYVRGEAPCSCADGGEFGHRFVCGWVPRATAAA